MILNISATILVLAEAIFLYGLTITGFKPPKSQIILIILGFITVLFAIWR